MILIFLIIPVFLFVDLYWGRYKRLYDKTKWFDLLLHTTAGVLITLSILKWCMRTWFLFSLGSAITAFSMTIAIGVL